MSALPDSVRARVLSVARVSSPPPLEDEAADAMIRHALAARADAATGGAPELGRAEPRNDRARRLAVVALAAAAMLALGYLARSALDASEGPTPTAEAPLELTLPSGDRLTATAGARFAIREAGARRRVEVRAGTLLADVRPLEEGERFALETPHGVAAVRGTVFSVEVRDGHTVVRVYEGRVEVTTGERARVLIAGQRVTMDGRVFDVEPGRTVEPEEGGALRREAEAAVRARTGGAVAGSTGSEPGATAAGRALVVVEVRPASAGSGARSVAPSPSPESLATDDPAREESTGALERPPRPAYARRWIDDGQPERALDAADLALARGHHGATWQMVRGDALRAMGRHAEAVAAYELAALGYGSALAARACFAAASTRWHHLHDAEGALASLERLRCTEGDPVATRQARTLREQLLRATGRDAPMGSERAGRTLGAP